MNPPQLPDPGKTEVSSVCHKAANYAVFMIPISFGLNPMMQNLSKIAADPFFRQAVNSIPALVLLSAVPAGIVALCGIPQYGRKKLLWKGLVGILVPVLLIVMMIPLILTVRKKAEERARIHQVAP